LALLLAGHTGLGPGGAQSATAAGTPTGYLLSAQHRDGGFGSSPGAPSSQLYAGWAALGLEAEGHSAADVRHGGRSLLDYIQGGVSAAMDSGSLERTILAVRAAGASVRNVGGHDLVALLEARIRGDGSVNEQVNWTSFAVLALRAAGVNPPSRSYSWLIRQQDRDGGFNFATAGGGSDVDDTGAALQALAHAPGAGAARSKAVRFIRRAQNRDGGLPSQPGGESNAQSAAWAIQGLVAAGVDPGSVRRGNSISPLRYLQSLTGSDGHIHYSRTSDQTPVWVTSQAVMALSRKALPLAPVRASRQAGGTGSSGQGGRSGASAANRKSKKTAHQAAAANAAGHANSTLLRYASDAGLVVAIALAPVGIG